MKHTDVAIGLVLREGRILICRRLKDAALGGLWEFPGGKCEAGESPRQCLIRELEEEVGLRVIPTHAFSTIDFTYDHATVRLHPYLCHHGAGEAAPNASEELRWVAPRELFDYEFPPANAALLKELISILDAGTGPLT